MTPPTDGVRPTRMCRVPAGHFAVLGRNDVLRGAIRADRDQGARPTGDTIRARCPKDRIERTHRHANSSLGDTVAERLDRDAARTEGPIKAATTDAEYGDIYVARANPQARLPLGRHPVPDKRSGVEAEDRKMRVPRLSSRPLTAEAVDGKPICMADDRWDRTTVSKNT